MPLKILLSMFLLFTAPAFAAEELNLGSEGKASVSMREAEGEYELTILLPSGRSQKIRDQFVPFEFEGTPAAIAITDLDGDGAEEFVVRAMIPPIAGGIYVYRFSGKEKKFVPMVTGKTADDTYLPVDAVAPVNIDREGNVKARIIVRGELDEKTEDREFRFAKGKFKRAR